MNRNFQIHISLTFNQDKIQPSILQRILSMYNTQIFNPQTSNIQRLNMNSLTIIDLDNFVQTFNINLNKSYSFKHLLKHVICYLCLCLSVIRKEIDKQTMKDILKFNTLEDIWRRYGSELIFGFIKRMRIRFRNCDIELPHLTLLQYISEIWKLSIRKIYTAIQSEWNFINLLDKFIAIIKESINDIFNQSGYTILLL